MCEKISLRSVFINIERLFHTYTFRYISHARMTNLINDKSNLAPLSLFIFSVASLWVGSNLLICTYG